VDRPGRGRVCTLGRTTPVAARRAATEASPISPADVRSKSTVASPTALTSSGCAARGATPLEATEVAAAGSSSSVSARGASTSTPPLLGGLCTPATPLVSPHPTREAATGAVVVAVRGGAPAASLPPHVNAPGVEDVEASPAA
jgi:hypothetical protein